MYDAKETEKTIAEEAGLPDNWVPIDVAPIIPGTPMQGVDVSRDGASKYLQGSLPPGYQHDTSFVDTAYRSPTVPQLSLMPLGLAGNPTTNASIQSTANKLIAAIPKVVIPPAAAVVTDGLIHGDAIWETDSAYVAYRDDFGIMSSTTVIASSTVGDCHWQQLGTFTPRNRSFAAPNLGVLIMDGSPAAIDTFFGIDWNTRNAYGTDTIGDFWSLLDYPNWKATFIFSPLIFSGIYATANDFDTQFIAHTRMYVGLEGGGSDNGGDERNVRPFIFIGVRYDTEAGFADTTYKLEVVVNSIAAGINNTQGTVVDTGVTPTVSTFHRLDIQCITAGVITMSFDGAASQSFTVPQATVDVNPSGLGQFRSVIGTHEAFFNTQGQGGGVPFAGGSKIVMSNMTLGNAFLNGPYVVRFANASNIEVPWVGGTNTLNAIAFTAKGLPALLPVARLGTDHTAVGTFNKSLGMDYFSFVWNPGVGGGTGIPAATNSRYF